MKDDGYRSFLYNVKNLHPLKEMSMSALRPVARLSLVAICTLTVLFICGCGAPEGNVADGKRWYLKNNCNSCHGEHGNDGRAVDISNIDMRFGSFLRKLRKTDAPIMPPFPENKLSDQDAADIYAYLKSIE